MAGEVIWELTQVFGATASLSTSKQLPWTDFLLLWNHSQMTRVAFELHDALSSAQARTNSSLRLINCGVGEIGDARAPSHVTETLRLDGCNCSQRFQHASLKASSRYHAGHLELHETWYHHQVKNKSRTVSWNLPHMWLESLCSCCETSSTGELFSWVVLLSNLLKCIQSHSLGAA